MLFNPSGQYFAPEFGNDLRQIVMGGHHYIYVTRQEYDGCESMATKLFNKWCNYEIKAIAAVTWTAWPVGVPSHPLLSVQEGLVKRSQSPIESR